ncbi:MAG: hypothetical protein DME74_12495, partial [Verrucomicrobia bacterium]
MAGLECLQPEDPDIDPQFCLYAESLLPGNYRPSAALLGRRGGFDCADATITVWRRGDRQRALIVGGTTTFFGAIVMAQFALVVWGIIQAPFFGSFAYLGIVVALGYQLSDDAVRAAHLASELQIGEERFRRVVEAAPNAMIMVNQEGQITLANQQAEKTFGYPREELLGRPIEMLVPERVRSGHRGFRHDYLCDPQARPMGAGRELFGRRKDGSEVPVEIGLSPIHT